MWKRLNVLPPLSSSFYTRLECLLVFHKILFKIFVKNISDFVFEFKKNNTQKDANISKFGFVNNIQANVVNMLILIH